jgi:hypothetical protein
VLIETEQGDIRVEVFAQAAPVTAANFLRYVDEGRFAGAFFYRVVTMANQPENAVKIEVIQGGLGFQESENRLPPIPHETTAETGILHTDGTLSMARSAPGSRRDGGGARHPTGSRRWADAAGGRPHSECATVGLIGGIRRFRESGPPGFGVGNPGILECRNPGTRG